MCQCQSVAHSRKTLLNLPKLVHHYRGRNQGNGLLKCPLKPPINSENIEPIEYCEQRDQKEECVC